MDEMDELDFYMNKFYAEAEGYVPIDFPYKRTYNGVYSRFAGPHNRMVQANYEYAQPMWRYRDAQREYYEVRENALAKAIRIRRKRRANLQRYRNEAWRKAQLDAYLSWRDNKDWAAAMQ